MATLANIDIQVGVNCSYRQNAERFKPTVAYSHTFYYTTTSSAYQDVVMDAAVDVWDYLLQQDAIADRIDIHYAVRVANVTHPTPAKGVVPLAKAHRDGASTRAQIQTRDDIEGALLIIINDLLSTAKYT